MKCPFKFGNYQFEGGKECDPECAWLMVDADGAFVCAVAALACGTEGVLFAANMKEMDE